MTRRLPHNLLAGHGKAKWPLWVSWKTLLIVVAGGWIAFRLLLR